MSQAQYLDILILSYQYNIDDNTSLVNQFTCGQFNEALLLSPNQSTIYAIDSEASNDTKYCPFRCSILILAFADTNSNQNPVCTANIR